MKTNVKYWQGGGKNEILVTGGKGFVGKELVKQLEFHHPAELILVPSSNELDLSNENQVVHYFESHSIGIVFHLAARLGGVGQVTSKPLFYLENNLKLNYNIVKYSIKYGVEKFITLGSSCCYNNDLTLPMNEKDIWNNRTENTYGTCKLVLLEHLQCQKQMQWVYLVPPNIYGPGDHFGSSDAHLIPATIEKFENALRLNENRIVVWGDGSQIRDFVYLDDIVYALLDAKDNSKYNNKVINVATAVGISVKEVVFKLRSLLGLENIDIEWDITKPTGTLKKVLDNKRFLDINCGFQFININEGLQRTVDWYKKNRY